MTYQPRKMSEMMKEMSERVLRNPEGDFSSEAAHAALLLAQLAWNKAVGLPRDVEKYRSAWEMLEAENPDLWSEFQSDDVHALVEELVQFKNQHYPEDQRRILLCGIRNGNIRVEWLPPAAPGVDSQWELELYALVRTDQREQAIQFLRETRQLSRKEAMKQVKQIAANLGMG